MTARSTIVLCDPDRNFSLTDWAPAASSPPRQRWPSFLLRNFGGAAHGVPRLGATPLRWVQGRRVRCGKRLVH